MVLELQLLFGLSNQSDTWCCEEQISGYFPVAGCKLIPEVICKDKGRLITLCPQQQ